ncbi:hypothetical protein [Micromonospora thermarum]|uniref:Uncharacterized protein n=1 Tax=Micromonospora thermarum TaxID=2720024 RepID=A0ABX0Z7B6_9ACTN|nr:hypothetical protein [Micromonospora thermarum]NJP33747.1 hypothetical protein [Micromonospora thermarum]
MTSIFNTPIMLFSSPRISGENVSAFAFVSHRARTGDRVVQASRAPKRDDDRTISRAVFVIEDAGSRLSRIRCPAYDNRYLFFSWDKEKSRHLVEAKTDGSDDRTLMHITEVHPGEYVIVCPATRNSYMNVSTIKDGSDLYICHDTDDISTFKILRPGGPS